MPDEKEEQKVEKMRNVFELYHTYATAVKAEETAFDAVWNAYEKLTGGKYFHDKESKQYTHLGEKFRKLRAMEKWVKDMAKIHVK